MKQMSPFLFVQIYHKSNRRVKAATPTKFSHIRIFTIRKSDTFLSDYLTDLKLYSKK